MKIYSRITINNTKKATLETQNLLSEFYKKSSCYLINKDIQLFSIPTDAEEYNYIRKLKLLAPREVYFSEFFEKKYDKQDYFNAVAYVINFKNMSYGYGNKGAADYFEKCCKCGNLFLNQVKDYEMPMSEMKNKHFTQLDIFRFAVSEKVKDELLELRVSKDVFRPVWQKNKQGLPVCYQLSPINTLPSISEVNGWRSYIGCQHCNKVLFDWDNDQFYYLSSEAVDLLQDFNLTTEQVGNLCTPKYLVNKKIYEYLIYRYKNMYFEPVFLKEV